MYLVCPFLILYLGRNAGGELDQPVIEEWLTQLNRRGHAHSVGLDEDGRWGATSCIDVQATGSGRPVQPPAVQDFEDQPRIEMAKPLLKIGAIDGCPLPVIVKVGRLDSAGERLP
jgi:hypothetical protein